MTGEVERLKAEEAQAAQDKKKAAEALMEEVHRSNAEQVLFPSAAVKTRPAYRAMLCHRNTEGCPEL